MNIQTQNQVAALKSNHACIKENPEGVCRVAQPSFPTQQKLIGSFSYTPSFKNKQSLTEEQIEKEAKAIFDWAKTKGAKRYCLLCYPHTDGIFEKHESFLNIDYRVNNSELIQSVSLDFPGSLLAKGEGDGSSVPSGGLRQTHQARAYMLWDHYSKLFVRRRNNTLYIPSFLTCHNGKALDMKALFRKSERVLQKKAVNLLAKLGVEATGTKMLLGLEQEFFVVPKEAYEKRQDLKWLGRTLVGNNPARNQQLNQHYYGKIPHIIEQVLAEIEEELCEIGVAFKTRHNEVALNQFQISCVYSEAGEAIDQNVMLMQIIAEAFGRRGLVALFHEKPFQHINGSGKHANWNISYVKKDGSLKNVFKLNEDDTEKDVQIYKLFILTQLIAIRKYEKLYLTGVSTPGNQIRLGGHEAPPRIFSVFCGQALDSLLEGKPAPTINNLKDQLNVIKFNAFQENSDRNRSSPFAYTGKVFEFRAVGSSQNVAFPMAIIAATMADVIDEVSNLLDSGKDIKEIIAQFVELSRKVRFESNGYSHQWQEQAKKRGLYSNQKFSELYTFLDTQQEVFTKIGVSTPEQNVSRAEVAKSNYKNLVQIEADTLIYIARRNIIPHALTYLRTSFVEQSSIISYYGKHIKDKLQKVINRIEGLQELKRENCETLNGCQKIRDEILKIGELISELTSFLPKNQTFPDQSEFLNL